MFSRENRRFLILVVAILILTVVTLTLMASLITNGHPAQTTFLTGFVTLIIVQLITMARQEQANQSAILQRQTIEKKLTTAATAAGEAKVAASHVREAVEKISKTSGQTLVRTVEKVADKVRVAERDQLLDEMDLPRTRMELRRLLAEMVDSACHEKVQSVAETAAKATVNEMVSELRRLNLINCPPETPTQKEA